ncbi:zinc-ribbon domain-containing protein [Arthrobacter sp. GCM10027362]|uniref:zinc-ribbon domain-containing protein n=1 Tax=Arthrobacter sp. GCM10027362 TaxID=3273379 RepID=UPI003631D990
MPADPHRLLPAPLRIQAWPGETVYSFANRLEQRLKATKGVISHLAYAEAARRLGKRAISSQTTNQMVKICEAMCGLPTGTLTTPMGNQPMSSHMCRDCTGAPCVEYVWTGGNYTCSIHRRWIAVGPSPKRPSTYAPHPYGPYSSEYLSPDVVEADLLYQALAACGRITDTLVDEVVRRVDSALGQEHCGYPRPGNLPTVTAVLTLLTEPEVQAAVLDEAVTFAERYSRLVAVLDRSVPGSGPELCDQIWLLLRPTAVWVRTILLSEAAVEKFDPVIIPDPGLDLSMVRYPLEPFRRSMDCLRTAGQDDSRWWKDRFVLQTSWDRDRRRLLICSNGHVQRSLRAHARRFEDEDFHCTICTGSRVVAGLSSLGDVMPRFVTEWDYSANDGLTPFKVSPGSNRKVGWICAMGHHYKAYIANRTIQHTGCPDCAAVRFRSFAATHSELAELWDGEANGNLKPTDVTSGDTVTKVHWRCKKGHSFIRSPAYMLQSRGRCTSCHGRTLTVGAKNLATRRPDIASWWHPTKNTGLTPDMVRPGSDLLVWWQCPEGHEFQAVIGNRCRQGKLTCPVDTGWLLLPGVNDVATKESDLVKDWNSSRNGMEPFQTVRGRRPWWWTCCFGHTQRATVAQRRRSGGCTECAPEDRVSKGQLKLTQGRNGWDKRKKKQNDPQP